MTEAFNPGSLSSEEWRAKKKEEKEAVVLAQRDELNRLFEDSEALGQYFIGCGRMGDHLTSGNAALILKQCPDARAVMNYDQWRNFGRSIRKDEHGILVLGRNNNYLTTSYVFDISQTYGNKPYPVTELAKTPELLEKAIGVLKEFSPIPVVAKDGQSEPVLYDTEKRALYYSPNLSNCELFQQLPVCLVQAITDEYNFGDGIHPLTVFYGNAASLHLCGRMGVEPMPDYGEKLKNARSLIHEGEERESLEEIRDLAKSMGDVLERRLNLQRDDRNTVLNAR